MGRRGAGEGSITLRSDGRYMAQVDLGWEGGKRKRATVYAKTKKEILAKLDQKRSEVSSGLRLTRGPGTVEQCVLEWLQSKQGRVSRGTYDVYRSYVNRHLLPGLGRIKLDQLDPDHVDRFFAQSPLSAWPKIHLKRALGSAIRRAQKRGIVLRNVVEMTDALPEPRERVVPFTRDEVKRILAEVRGDPHEALYLLAFMCGLRQGEVLGLTWDCVDWAAGTVEIKQQLQQGRLVPTKTRNSHRTLALPPVIVEALRKHREEQPVISLRGFIFLSRGGGPLRKATLMLRLWYPLLERSGVERRTFHTTRHSAATFMLTAGVPIEVISDILGHSSIVVTKDIYAHVMPELHRSAAEAVAGMLA